MMAGRAALPRGHHLRSRGRRKNRRIVIQKIFEELPVPGGEGRIKNVE